MMKCWRSAPTATAPVTPLVEQVTVHFAMVKEMSVQVARFKENIPLR